MEPLPPPTEPKPELEDKDDSAAEEDTTTLPGQVPKKKKKRNKKKKEAVKAPEQLIPVGTEIPQEELVAPTQTNERFRLLGGWPQPVTMNFPNDKFDGYEPCQVHEYGVPRVSTQELKNRQAKAEKQLQFLRKAAEIQRQVRRFAQKVIKPGRKLIDICEELEAYNRALAPQKSLDSGIAFPTGCSINHCAAHFTPNPDDKTVLGYDDVCKIDFGTHIKGRIIDCAFTVAFNPTYDKLLEAVKAATEAGLKAAGIDARLGDVGAAIEETMQSYEVEIRGKVYPVKVVRNLNGHSIAPYKIHAGKTVPCIKNNSNIKMEENQQYAIETFGSTGKGLVKEESDCSHYMKDFYLPPHARVPPRSKPFLDYINENYDTLCFCKRWLERENVPNYTLSLRDLVQNGIINPYPPLCDVEGSYVAQWEHTLFLRPTCKEILSRGTDF